MDLVLHVAYESLMLLAVKLSIHLLYFITW